MWVFFASLPLLRCRNGLFVCSRMYVVCGVNGGLSISAAKLFLWVSSRYVDCNLRLCIFIYGRHFTLSSISCCYVRVFVGRHSIICLNLIWLVENVTCTQLAIILLVMGRVSGFLKGPFLYPSFLCRLQKTCATQSVTLFLQHTDNIKIFREVTNETVCCISSKMT